MLLLLRHVVGSFEPEVQRLGQEEVDDAAEPVMAIQRVVDGDVVRRDELDAVVLQDRPARDRDDVAPGDRSQLTLFALLGRRAPRRPGGVGSAPGAVGSAPGGVGSLPAGGAGSLPGGAGSPAGGVGSCARAVRTYPHRNAAAQRATKLARPSNLRMLTSRDTAFESPNYTAISTAYAASASVSATISCAFFHNQVIYVSNSLISGLGVANRIHHWPFALCVGFVERVDELVRRRTAAGRRPSRRCR